MDLEAIILVANRPTVLCVRSGLEKQFYHLLKQTVIYLLVKWAVSALITDLPGASDLLLQRLVRKQPAREFVSASFGRWMPRDVTATAKYSTTSHLILLRCPIYRLWMCSQRVLFSWQANRGLLWGGRWCVVQMMEDSEFGRIRLKYGCILYRPLFQCKDGFNLSTGLKNLTVCAFCWAAHELCKWLWIRFICHLSSRNCERTRLKRLKLYVIGKM